MESAITGQRMNGGALHARRFCTCGTTGRHRILPRKLDCLSLSGMETSEEWASSHNSANRGCLWVSQLCVCVCVGGVLKQICNNRSLSLSIPQEKEERHSSKPSSSNLSSSNATMSKDRHSSSSRDKHEKHKSSRDKDKQAGKRPAESPSSSDDLFGKQRRGSSSNRSPTEHRSKEKNNDNKRTSKESSSSKHSSHIKHKSSRKDKSEASKDTSESKSKHHKHEKEKKHSKEKHSSERDVKKDRESKVHTSSTKSTQRMTKKFSSFADGESSDVDPFAFSDDEDTKNVKSLPSKRDAGLVASQALQSFLDKEDEMSNSDCELLTPLDSPPNIFSQHHKSNPRKSPANASDRATPTSQHSGTGSHRDSPSSHKSHSSAKSNKSKHSEKDGAGTAAKKSKLDKHHKESSKVNRKTGDREVDKVTQKQNGDASRVEKTDQDKKSGDTAEVAADPEVQPSNGESLMVLVEVRSPHSSADFKCFLSRTSFERSARRRRAFLESGGSNVHCWPFQGKAVVIFQTLRLCACAINPVIERFCP